MEKVSCEELIKNAPEVVEIGRYKVRLTTPLLSIESEPGLEAPTTTVWSFPDRGRWETHRGDYPGNFSPYIPRYAIQLYSQPGDLVLDPMVGSGTTLVEAKLLGRRAIGVDISLEALRIAAFRVWYAGHPGCDGIELYRGDTRRLEKIGDNTVDLIVTHPPYANIIKYSGEGADLSRLSPKKFVVAMGAVAAELYRVLKPGKYMAILVGDTRVRRYFVPLAYAVLRKFLEVGFVIKEDVIKIQHNMRGTLTRWRGRRDFLLIAHEHLFVLYKPVSDEERKRLKLSGGELIWI